jgi:hypothetical protein
MNVDDVDDIGNFDFLESNGFVACDGHGSIDLDFCDSSKPAAHRMRLLMLYLCALDHPETSRKRKVVKKTWEERAAPWKFIESWSDDMFSRQFRMTRDLYFRLLRRIIFIYPGPHTEGEKNYQYSCRQGDNAHGCHILLQIRLCITLRLLAGASYLDMIWYGVSIGYVESIFKGCLHFIHLALPDGFIFNFNATTDFNLMAHEWSQIMLRRRSHDLMKGTILAGDGLVIEIQGGTEEDRGGLDPGAFRNRKGFFGLIVQAFCDAFCMFRYFEISWPGSTPDITAYKQTQLYQMFMQGVLDGYHMVLDEAYSSIGGDQHLTPFSKHQLRRAQARSHTLYCQMKTFNNILSGQRITIERAFGILVRKWGIFKDTRSKL